MCENDGLSTEIRFLGSWRSLDHQSLLMVVAGWGLDSSDSTLEPRVTLDGEDGALLPVLTTSCQGDS